MNESVRADLEVERLCLVDVASENDSLIAEPCVPSCPAVQQLLEKYQKDDGILFADVAYAMESDDTANTLVPSEQLPQSSESFKPLRRITKKCNLRKSLAWDSAFFTGAGVLEPEELSSMMEGVEKSEKILLPAIEEDVYKSTDSLSTLGSESLTLDGLEADLFLDIRASIQRSSKTSNVSSSSGKSVFGGTESPAICSSENVDSAAQDMMEAKPAPKMEAKKCTTIRKMQGLGKPIKQQTSGCPNPSQSVARKGVTSSVSERANIIGSRGNPISAAPSKISSFGVKAESNNVKGTTTAISRGAKESRPPGSNRVMPKPALSSKPSSLSSSKTSKTVSVRSSSSSDSSAISTSTHNIGKSPSTHAKRKIDSRTPNPPSTGSFPETLSNIALKNKAQSGKSISKFPASISPGSSISDWSSLSSSTSTTVNQRPNMLRASLDSNSSSRSINSDGPPPLKLQMRHPPMGQISDGHENQAKGGPLSRNATKVPTRAADSLSGTTAGKPSGLRMPSPKIGFFDGAKTLVRANSDGMQSQTGLTKIGSGHCSPSATSNKPKLGKIQLTTAVAAGIRNTKLGTRKPPNTSTTTSTALRVLKSSPTISPKVQTGTESGLDGEVGIEGLGMDKHVSDVGRDAEKNEKDQLATTVAGIRNMKLDTRKLVFAVSLKDSPNSLRVLKSSPTISPIGLDGEELGFEGLGTDNHVSDVEKNGENHTVAAIRTMKVDTRKLASPSSPKDSPNAFRVSTGSPTISPSGLDGEELGFEGLGMDKHVTDVVLEAEKNGSRGSVKSKLNSEMHHQEMDIREIKVSPIEWDTCKHISLSQKSDREHHSSNNKHLLVKSNENEVVLFNGEAGDGLMDKIDSPDCERANLLSAYCQDESLTATTQKLTPAAALSPSTVEVTAGSRIPLAVKDSFCNSNVGLDFLTGPVIENVVEKGTTLSSPLESAQKTSS